jgi:hypothetical protein
VDDGGVAVGLVDVGESDCPFTAPETMPRMKWRWRNTYNTTTGVATITAPAASRVRSD